MLNCQATVDSGNFLSGQSCDGTTKFVTHGPCLLQPVFATLNCCYSIPVSPTCASASGPSKEPIPAYGCKRAPHSLQMKGYDTRALWLDIAQQIGEVRERLGQAGGAPYFKSGPSMFGFSDVKIVPLIEVGLHP